MPNVFGLLTKWGPKIIAMTGLSDQLWQALNKNGRVEQGMNTLFAQLSAAMKQRDPLGRLDAQLDSLRTYLSDDPEVDDAIVGRWRHELTLLQRKLALVRTQAPQDRKPTLVAMERQAGELFAQIVGVTAEDVSAKPIAVEQPKRRLALPFRRQPSIPGDAHPCQD